jgi:hypothetical protein
MDTALIPDLSLPEIEKRIREKVLGGEMAFLPQVSEKMKALEALAKTKPDGDDPTIALCDISHALLSGKPTDKGPCGKRGQSTVTVAGPDSSGRKLTVYGVLPASNTPGYLIITDFVRG